ncbi:MAG: hypothetical protein VKS61_08655 [Candidatus Sericytochromatia bacterium]|nr:hypothetical protein [Candidatus Sericytochromatia bacterium]
MAINAGTIGQDARQDPSAGYWMFSARADAGWFGWSVIVPLLLYLPAYWTLGSAAVWPLYLVYVACFATPHLWMTWVVTGSRQARGMYASRTWWLPVAVTAAIVAIVPFTRDVGGWDAFFTGMTLLGAYHILKQHLGMLKIYDARYVQWTGDAGFVSQMRPFRWLCGLAFALPVWWVWTMPSLDIVVDVQRFRLLSPEVPSWTLWPYVATLVALALRCAWTLVRRHRAGKPLPTAHLVLAAAAGLSYLAAFGLVPTRDYLLSLAIFITYHDLQYIGFVWMFQRRRAGWLVAAGHGLDFVHALAEANRPLPYLGLAGAFSLLVVGLIVALPPAGAIGVVVFVNVVHYLMDGMVWQRRHYPGLHAHLGPAGAR